jgi:cytoskeletal protein CcmA (bactofilin family)
MPKPMGDLETIIGPGVKLEGNFVGEGNIVIKGQVKGSIQTKNDLRVDESASVQSDAKAKNLYLAGEIRGNIHVDEKAVLAGSARLFGDLECKVLAVEEGATFIGKCAMGDYKSHKEKQAAEEKEKEEGSNEEEE